MSIINGVGRVGWKNYVATSPSYILDTYTSATVGYSLRKLSSAYTGSAIRVRRSSDNTEQNIGFDASGNLDTTALLAFVGSGNGFVTTWYNQSGDTSNNNPSWPGYTNKTMIQTSAANQPIIVTSGVVELKSGKPTIKFSANKYLNLPIIGLTNTLMFDVADHSFFAVYEKDTTGNVSNFLGYNVGYLWLDYGGTQYNGNNSMSGTIGANALKLISLSNIWTTSQKFYTNNSLLGTRTGSGAAGCDIYRIKDPSHSYTTYFSEIIMYRNAQTSNISNINNAINSYYSIYTNYVTSGLALMLDAGNTLSYPGTGTAWTDLSGNGNNATLVNGAAYSSSNGGTMVFDGINDKVSFNFGTMIGLIPSRPASVSIWCKFNNTNSRQVLFGDWNSSGGAETSKLEIDGPSSTTRKVQGYLQTGNYAGIQVLQSTDYILPNTWYYITIQNTSATNSQLYINGVLNGEKTTNLITYTSTGNLALGAAGDSNSLYLNGNISIFQVYNRALTPSEVTTNFNSLKSRYGL